MQCNKIYGVLQGETCGCVTLLCELVAIVERCASQADVITVCVHVCVCLRVHIRLCECVFRQIFSQKIAVAKRGSSYWISGPQYFLFESDFSSE